MIIINAQDMSPGMARYWNSLAKRLQVDVIDPWRIRLSYLRRDLPELKGKKIYRASTGGKWGRSSQITTL